MGARITEDITYCKLLLDAGELVAVPTETVYGLAANANDEVAVKKVFELKQRPTYNPLIVHIPNISYLASVTCRVPNKALELAERCWPGPLTLVLPKSDEIGPFITANKPTVAVRVPSHPIMQNLLSVLHYPLVAPSANPFMGISPTTAEHVREHFPIGLKAVLNGGRCKLGLESTIIGFEDEMPVLLRKGAIPQETLEKVVGPILQHAGNTQRPNAPGMLKKHYSPNTPLQIVPNLKEAIARHAGEKIGVVSFGPFSDPDVLVVEVLSATYDLGEAASKLYDSLHKLDALKLDLILSTPFPEMGLGITINDRLGRAAN